MGLPVEEFDDLSEDELGTDSLRSYIREQVREQREEERKREEAELNSI